ncbi:MAG: hypothetical protein AB7F64_00240 [Gammaproteobacteria bacterium]
MYQDRQHRPLDSKLATALNLLAINELTITDDEGEIVEKISARAHVNDACKKLSA